MQVQKVRWICVIHQALSSWAREIGESTQHNVAIKEKQKFVTFETILKSRLSEKAVWFLKRRPRNENTFLCRLPQQKGRGLQFEKFEARMGTCTAITCYMTARLILTRFDHRSGIKELLSTFSPTFFYFFSFWFSFALSTQLIIFQFMLFL